MGRGQMQGLPREMSRMRSKKWESTILQAGSDRLSTTS